MPMPYVNDALLLPLSTSLLLLLWVSFCGAALVRFCCSIRSWTLLPPLGLAAGCAIFLVCANLGKVGALPEGSGIAVLVGRVGTVPLAFGGAFLLLSALGIFASFRLRPRSWQLPSLHSLLAVCGYSLLALVLAYVCLAIRNQSYFYDFPTHLAFATTIARDNLPVHNPYCASIALRLPLWRRPPRRCAQQRSPAYPARDRLPTPRCHARCSTVCCWSLLLGRDAGKHVLWGLACLIAALAMGSLVALVAVRWDIAAARGLICLRGMFLAMSRSWSFPALASTFETLSIPFRLILYGSPLVLGLSTPLAGFFTVAALAITVVGPGETRSVGLGASMALSVAHCRCNRPLR